MDRRQDVQRRRRLVTHVRPLAPPIPEATLQRTAKRKVGGTKQESKAVDAEKDSKKQRRLIRNRMSAQLHRERKKAYLDKLEAQLKERTAECEALKAQVAHLTSENASLRGQLQRATGEPLAEPDVSGYLSSTTTSSE